MFLNNKKKILHIFLCFQFLCVDPHFHQACFFFFLKGLIFTFFFLFLVQVCLMNSLNFCESGESEVAQTCLTLGNPMDCSLPGSSIHGIFQARILEWVAISFSRGSSQPRDWTQVLYTAGRIFIIWATREAEEIFILLFLDGILQNI